MLPFSKNSVCVDIDDPEATDLTFVDLPGENVVDASHLLTYNAHIKKA